MHFPNNLLERMPARLRHTLKNIALSNFNFGKRAFYGQFGEDAFLQAYFTERRLSRGYNLPMAFHPRALDSGFYVEVGAFHPKFYSNTYRFYQRGWQGINIDAAPGSMAEFRKIRRRDMNLELAISDMESEIDFYYWGKLIGVNTFSPELAEIMSRRLGRNPTVIKVVSRRLEHVLDDYLPEHQIISFMSVDVEGHDLQVLRSNNWDKYRPELVLVEEHLLKIHQITTNLMSKFMSTVGYGLCAWLPPTMIFRDLTINDYRFSYE